MKKLIAVLLLLGTTPFILADASARGGGRGGGGRSGGMGRSSRGQSRGNNRDKDVKRDRERTDRENRDGFMRDTGDDAV